MKLMNREYIVAVSKKEKSIFDIRNLKFETIKNSFSYWIADPFPFEYNGTLYIFGEMYEYRTLKGAIAYTKLTDSGFTKWKKIIDESYHLSFPNIFTENDSIYMCPEARQSKQLYLYKCIDFPEVWIKDKVLADNVNYSDTVFFEENKRKMGLTCVWNSLKDHYLSMIEIKDDGCKLIEDRCHSLKKHVSRPGGKIFFDEAIKKNVVPIQICEPIYGSGLSLNSFEILNDHYIENVEKVVFPKDIKCNLNKKFDGIHTYNMSENYIVIDLIWSRFNAFEKMSRILKKLLGVK